jgi:hypothetical protein
MPTGYHMRPPAFVKNFTTALSLDQERSGCQEIRRWLGGKVPHSKSKPQIPNKSKIQEGNVQNKKHFGYLFWKLLFWYLNLFGFSDLGFLPVATISP